MRRHLYSPTHRGDPLGARVGSRIGGDQADADRVADEAGDVMHVELGHDAAAVALDGLDAQLQLLGDLGAGLALGDELKDLALAVGERIARGGAARGERPEPLSR